MCLHQEMENNKLINYGPHPMISAQQIPHPALISTCQPKHKKVKYAGGKRRVHPHPPALVLGTGHFSCHHSRWLIQHLHRQNMSRNTSQRKGTHRAATAEAPSKDIDSRSFALKLHQMLLQLSTTSSCSPLNFSRQEMKACRKSGG